MVVIGGGVGTDITLAGLKHYTSKLTALVSTFDASSRIGGGNGASPGDNVSNHDHSVDDVRSSLLALSNDTPTTNIMKSLFAYQFNQQAEHGGYNFGNLFMSALTEITGSTDLALQAAARMLNIQGQVLPMTLTPCPLVAHLSNGTTVTVDTPADLMAVASASGLRYVSLAQRVPALDAALQAIQDADIIVFGPTDFYFNLMAPMQLEGVAEALAASRAIKVFVCNILTQPNTTDNWPASRYIGVVLDALGGPRSLDYAIINSTSFALNALTI